MSNVDEAVSYYTEKMGYREAFRGGSTTRDSAAEHRRQETGDTRASHRACIRGGGAGAAPGAPAQGNAR